MRMTLIGDESLGKKLNGSIQIFSQKFLLTRHCVR